MWQKVFSDLKPIRNCLSFPTPLEVPHFDREFAIALVYHLRCTFFPSRNGTWLNSGFCFDPGKQYITRIKFHLQTLSHGKVYYHDLLYRWSCLFLGYLNAIGSFLSIHRLFRLSSSWTFLRHKYARSNSVNFVISSLQALLVHGPATGADVDGIHVDLESSKVALYW